MFTCFLYTFISNLWVNKTPGITVLSDIGIEFQLTMAVIESDSKKFLFFLKFFILIQFVQTISLIWTIVSTYSYAHWLFIYKPIFNTIITTVYKQVRQWRGQFINGNNKLMSLIQDPINVLVLMLVLIILQSFNVVVSLIGYVKQSTFYITASFITNCGLVMLNLISTLNTSDLVLSIVLTIVSSFGAIVTYNLRKQMAEESDRVNGSRRSIGKLQLINQIIN